LTSMSTPGGDALHPLVRSILAETPICIDAHHVVVPDADPVVPGHLLLLSRTPLHSLAAGNPQRLELFLKQTFALTCAAPYLVLEHGHAGFCSSFGAFVHAHAHLVPCDSVESVTFPSSRVLHFNTLAQALEAVAPGTEYLLWGESSGPASLILQPSLPKRAIRNELNRQKKAL